MSVRNNLPGQNNNGPTMNVNNAAAAASGRNTGVQKGRNGSNSNAQRRKIPDEELKKVKKMYIANEKRYREAYKPHEGRKKWEYRKYDSIMLEIHLHLYLIYSEYRNVAEIKIHEVPKEQLMAVSNYLTVNNINFEMIVVNPRNTLSNGLLKLCIPGPPGTCKNHAMRGVAVATELGEFYTCKAEQGEWEHYQWRIVITCDNSIDLFAQMCEKEQIIASMRTVIKVYEDLSRLFIELDRKRFEAFPANPLKISIYKVYKEEASAAGSNN